MTISLFEIIGITGLAFLKAVDYHTTQVVIFNCVFWGWVAGLIMGDPVTGLAVGGTLQLMSLGVVAIGGSSAPDYPLATIIATTLAISTGKGISAGLAVGIAVGMLAVQFDIMAKIINGVIARKAKEYCDKYEFGKMNRIIHVSLLLMGIVSAVPTLIAITAGEAAVNLILDAMPAWFTTGLSIAGGLLPAVGLAMLLTYMPTNKFIGYLLFGFVMSAYLKVPVLGVAIAGIGFAINYYSRRVKEERATNTAAVSGVEGGLEDE